MKYWKKGKKENRRRDLIMKKKFILIMFLMLSCILKGNYVFTTDGKDNFDKLSKSVWRNRLEKAEIKKIATKKRKGKTIFNAMTNRFSLSFFSE